jgi:hypothetical protein
VSRDLQREIAGCLRVAGSVDEHLLRLRKFSAQEWQASIRWLHLSGIALIFWDRLQTLKAEWAVPPQVGADLAADLANHRLRVTGMTREFDSLNRHFERERIKYAVLKGFALVPEYCPDACLRPTYDYDYLIAGDDHIRAQNVLQTAGYIRKPHQDAKHHVIFLPPAFHSGPRSFPAGYYSVSLPRMVELHLRLWDDEAFHIPLKTPAAPLNRALRRDSHGLAFYSLAEEDALVFHALHTFQHILHNWCRLGWLWEIAYFLEHRKLDTSFWLKFGDHVDGNGPLAEVMAMVFTLATGLFHATLPVQLKDQIPNAMRGQIALWIQRYGLRSALDNFSDNKYALFLYREFVHDKAVWRQIQRSRLLPLHRPNRVANAAQLPSRRSLPAICKQLLYVAHRLIHHSVSGVRYAWESARWRRLRRLNASQALSP